MPGGLCLAVCRNYLPEFEAALARIGGEGVLLAPYPALCGQPMMDWPTLDAALVAAGARGMDVRVIGGGCLLRLGEPPPGPWGDLRVLHEEHCFNMIAGSVLVRHLLGEREHLLNPGWLARWREYARCWGIDEATAGDFFGETIARLTLLDTGVLPGADKLLQEFARFSGRPWRVLPVGLDHLELFLGRIVERWRAQASLAEAAGAIARAAKESADYQMVFDLVGTLAQIKGEGETIGGVLDLFSLLFAPRSLALVRMEGNAIDGVEARPPTAVVDTDAILSFCARGNEQSERAGDSGFRVRIGHQGETLGILVVDQVRFPEHLEHYRHVAETVARVCGLALANAVAYQRLQTTVAELTAARDSVKALAGLIPICAHCKKIRDDSGYWQSVEKYVQDHTEATLTHGICPACIAQYFPGIHLPAPKVSGA